MLTDGLFHSYAIFIYQCDLIQWSGLDPIYGKIGINFGRGIELVHNLSGIEAANQIDCMNNATGSEWVNVIYDLNELTIESSQSSTITLSSDSIQTSSSPLVLSPSPTIRTSMLSFDSIQTSLNPPESSTFYDDVSLTISQKSGGSQTVNVSSTASRNLTVSESTQPITTSFPDSSSKYEVVCCFSQNMKFGLLKSVFCRHMSCVGCMCVTCLLMHVTCIILHTCHKL